MLPTREQIIANVCSAEASGCRGYTAEIFISVGKVIKMLATRAKKAGVCAVRPQKIAFFGAFSPKLIRTGVNQK
jgi:hypothetical protein